MTSPLRNALTNASARLRAQPDTAPIDQVVNAYVKLTGLSPTDLVGPSKAPAITAYRHELMYLIRRIDPAASFTLIGRFIGGRDMATVHEAIAKVEQRLQRETDYRFELESLRRQIVDMAQEAMRDRTGAQAKPWQLLAALSVLRDQQVTDPEARKAALSFLQQLEAQHA